MRDMAQGRFKGKRRNAVSREPFAEREDGFSMDRPPNQTSSWRGPSQLRHSSRAGARGFDESVLAVDHTESRGFEQASSPKLVRVAAPSRYRMATSGRFRKPGSASAAA